MSVYKITNSLDPDQELEVFDDKLTIRGRGKASSTIPFASISTVEYKKPGLVAGYLRFTSPGSKAKGWLPALDENAFTFEADQEAAVEEVRRFIERRMQEVKGSASTGGGVSDLIKLAELKERGLLTDDEFARAKQKLLGNKG